MPESLTKNESLAYGDLKLIIRDGAETFMCVGVALAQIHEKRLYREEYPTFAEFCRAEYGWTDRHVRRLMDASAVVGQLETGPIGPPTTESQARELTAVPPEDRAKVWEEAVESAPEGKPTAKDVRRAATPYKPKKLKKPGPREAAQAALREAEPNTAEPVRKASKNEGGDPTDGNDSADVTAGEPVGEKGADVVEKAPDAPGREVAAGSPDNGQRLAYLLNAESALAHAASFRGLGQSAVQNALETVRRVIEMLRQEEAA